MNLMIAMLLIIDPNCGLSTDLDSLRTASVNLEIHCLNESKYFSGDSNQIVKDLKIINERWWEVKDVPFLLACSAYPEFESIGEWLKLNRELKRLVKLKLIENPLRESELNQMLNELEYIYNAWDAVHDFLNINDSVINRRRHAKNIPFVLPPPIPTWRFVYYGN